MENIKANFLMRVVPVALGFIFLSECSPINQRFILSCGSGYNIRDTIPGEPATITAGDKSINVSSGKRPISGNTFIVGTNAFNVKAGQFSLSESNGLDPNPDSDVTILDKGIGFVQDGTTYTMTVTSDLPGAVTIEASCNLK